MQTNKKTKGFTLVELMVVISIVAMLSSVVLASIQTAREKAMLSRTVGEMKSLQNALELYKAQFGNYPGYSFGNIEGLNYDDDENCQLICGTGYAGNLETLLKTELVDRKFIAKVPHAPGYPNNCIESIDCYNKGYILGYSPTDFNTGRAYPESNDPDYYNMCGDQRVKNYVIYFYANSKKINLPLYTSVSGGIRHNIATDAQDLSIPPYLYCLSI